MVVLLFPAHDSSVTQDRCSTRDRALLRHEAEPAPPACSAAQTLVKAKGEGGGSSLILFVGSLFCQ